jgi:hypothetical protein
MNWIVMLVLAVLTPVIQPAVQTGVARVQERVQTAVQRVQQPNVQQPYVVFHEGRWWKYEGGQWYVWVEVR